MHKKVIKLPGIEGAFTEEVFVFENSDRRRIREIYSNWVNMDIDLRQLGGRRPIFPVEIVEAIVCIELNMYKVDNNRVYYDLYDPNPNRYDDLGRVNVKVAINETYRMQLNEKEIMDSDRIMFVKLYIERAELCYEIFEFQTRDIEEYLRFNRREINLRSSIRFSMAYREFMQIPNNAVLKGFL